MSNKILHTTPVEDENQTGPEAVNEELLEFQNRRPIVLFPSGRPEFPVIGIGKPGTWKAQRPAPGEQVFAESEVVPEKDRPKTFFGVPPAGPERIDGLVYPICGKVTQVHGLRCKTGVWEEIEFDLADKDGHRDRALRTAIHDAFRPMPDPIKGYPEVLNVPGQHQMTPGVPVVAVDKDNKATFLSIACGHTIKSLCQIPGIDYNEFVTDMTALAKLYFGDEDSLDPEKRKPTSELGYSPNLRSAKNSKRTGEGSFSMALTSGEGQGKGQVQPAVQNSGAEGVRRRIESNRISGKWTPRIRAASNLKEDYDAQVFLGTQCNVPGRGDRSNKLTTSTQLNFSFIHGADTDLTPSLGDVQARLHLDDNDHPEAKTNFYAFMKLTRGSDPGAFMFPQFGCYWHSYEELYSTPTY